VDDKVLMDACSTPNGDAVDWTSLDCPSFTGAFSVVEPISIFYTFSCSCTAEPVELLWNITE
jgi:hypothetical protein